MNRYWKRMMKYRPALFMEITRQPASLNYTNIKNTPGQNRRNRRGASTRK